MGSDLSQVLLAAAERAIAYRETTSRDQRQPQGYTQSLAAFASVLPEAGAPGATVIGRLATLAEPGLRRMTGDTFFGWVIGGSHPVGVAADWLTAAWGQNAGNHVASPAASAAEAVAAGWLLDLLDLPREASVGFVTGATAANFVCLAAARGAVLRKAGWDVEADGLFGAPSVSVLIGDDAHTTVFSALQFLGFGHDRVQRIATDDQGRIRADDFSAALASVSGPAIAILQAGQINTGGFDDFARLVPLAHAAGAWVHVDGAFGLWARATPSKAALADGLEQADSWATDGHKWLQTPYDCGYAIVRDEEAHRRAMTISASYLPTAAAGDRDPSHYVPELSRRARGFATWAMIAHLGRDGIAAMVERHCAVAGRIAAGLRESNDIEVLNDVVLNQMLVRFGDDDRLTQEVVGRIQADGRIFAGGAAWRGKQVMRLSVISWLTNLASGDEAVAAILSAWSAVKNTP